MKTRLIYIVLTTLLLMAGSSYSQLKQKTYLLLTSENFRKEHIIKEDKLVRLWVNDSTSYLGFLNFQDSVTISIKDTLIETKDIVQLKARNKRRSTGAVFTIISPTLCGIAVDIILKYSNVYGTFTFFRQPASVFAEVQSAL